VLRIFILALILLFSSCTPHFEDRIGLVYNKENIEHGESLVKGLAACGYCHGSYRSPNAPLSGGRKFSDRYGEILASNITPSVSGIGAWSLSDFIKALRSNTTPSGEYLSKSIHEGYHWLSDRDLAAIFSYLVAQEPILNHLEKRSVGSLERSTLGFWEGSVHVRGFIPEIKSDNNYEYGSYLVKHVARCSTCHDGPTKIFGSTDELAGGKILSSPVGEDIVVPPLIGSTFKRRWNNLRLLDYLKGENSVGLQGKIQTGRKLCPTDFFKSAKLKDLESLSQYIAKIK
jgi:hypothetical protein